MIDNLSFEYFKSIVFNTVWPIPTKNKYSWLKGYYNVFMHNLKKNVVCLNSALNSAELLIN